MLYDVCDVWKNRILAITQRSEMGLYEVYLLGFGMSIMFANFHVCRMMLFNAMLYMLVVFYCLLDLSCCECNVM